MRHLVPSNILTLNPYYPGKPIEDVEREFGIKDSIKLASNENPLGPSPKALATIKKYLKKIHLYPDSTTYYLKQMLSSYLKVSEKNIIIGNGSNEIIELIARTFLTPQSESVIADQAFIVYQMIVQAVGAKKIIVPLKNYTHNLLGMAECINKNTRIIFIANPNNPTGTIVNDEVFEQFLNLVPEDVLVVLDEAYMEYVTDKNYPNSIQYLSTRNNLIILRTFSKIYGLAGLRIGYGIANQEVIELLNKIRQPFNVNSLAQVAAIASLSDEAHVKRSLENNEEGKAYLYNEFERLGLSYVPTSANFILVHCEQDCTILSNKLLKLGVIVRPMRSYNFPNSIRVTIGLPKENNKFISALKKVLSH
ncbi:MAG: histidinol-phosphate transaminase [Candidatus Schekmanbacteria bacterium RIFCSPHIGHO2_02_FULL_38_11]|nr:MAG: histidinol-phosphate transaminase [Candidatus Schekmanbacteria bacterium RIFCSPHIGHO2_02_FULL_38_11]